METTAVKSTAHGPSVISGVYTLIVVVKLGLIFGPGLVTYTLYIICFTLAFLEVLKAL